MKKKILILIPILFIICFSSTASALTTEELTGVDNPGLHIYMQWFDDFSGVLSVATTATNNSGIMEAFIITSVLCTNANRTFRLRIYDSDEKMFIEAQNENGIGSAVRKFTVRTHRDTLKTVWTVYVTDISAEIFYAQISLLYLYDEDADDFYKGEDPEEQGVSQEEHDKAVKRAKLENRIAGTIMAFLGVVVAIGYIRRMK